MARSALQMTMRELAKRAGVSTMTINRFENEQSGGYAKTLAAIRRALEAAGAEFTNGDAPGVRLKPPPHPGSA